MEQDFGDAALFVVKDPRMCRLMPIWREVLQRVGAQPRFAIAIRNPLEVARSLERRDGFPLAHGCLLWLGHMLEAERATRGETRVFVSYEELLDKPDQAAGRVAAQLGFAAPAMSGNGAQDIAAFIEPALRHHLADTAELEAGEAFYPWLLEAHGAFTALIRSPADEKAQRRLDDVQAHFAPAVASFAPLIATRDKTIADLQTGAINLHEALAKRESDMARLEQTLTERESEIAQFERTLTEQEGSIVRLEHTLTEKDNELISFLGVIASLEATISQFYASTSWRVTKPLRWIRRLVAPQASRIDDNRPYKGDVARPDGQK